MHGSMETFDFTMREWKPASSLHLEKRRVKTFVGWFPCPRWDANGLASDYFRAHLEEHIDICIKVSAVVSAGVEGSCKWSKDAIIW